MQHDDQYREAIHHTLAVRSAVSAEIFDDKVRSMGSITVENGVIEIKLHSLPAMVSNETTGKFLVESIALGIEACWKAHPQAFESLT